MPKKNKNGDFVLDPIYVNIAIAIKYRTKINRLIKSMSKDMRKFAYKEYTKFIELDPHLQNTKAINQLIARLENNFIKNKTDLMRKSDPVINNFVESIKKYVTNKLVLEIKEISKVMLLKMSQETRNIALTQKVIIENNVQKISSLPEISKTQITEVMMDSIAYSRDRQYVKDQLSQLEPISEKRLNFLVQDQCRKATIAFNNARQIDAGIIWQEWMYTGVSKEPRLDHKAANGKEFKLAEGCLISGEYIYPAELPGCKCLSRAIIKIN